MADQKEVELIERIAHRAFVQATKMIYDANYRTDEQEGDPKVGGHPAACSSCIHVMTALHVGVREPADMVAVKPHGSPTDHAINHLLQVFVAPGTRRWMSPEEAKACMPNLRKFSQAGEPVFQSYHAESDPDGYVYFPSGSVGIPPVVSMYTALAYRYGRHHRLKVPKSAHFWSLMGDSEFREGSLMEAMPEAAERELGNVTWIVDYNRQNLDGTRIPNERGLRGSDARRMENVAKANGWDVIQCHHGRKRQAMFARPGGAALCKVLEEGFGDFEFQMMILKRDGAVVRERILAADKKLEKFLKDLSDEALYQILADLGGHDVAVMLDALRESKRDPMNPTLIVAHTIKGWGLSSYAQPGNHSTIIEDDEVKTLLGKDGLSESDPYALFSEESEEGKFLAGRKALLREGREAIWRMTDENRAFFAEQSQKLNGFPDTLGVNLKLYPQVHTQYVWGQLAAKLIRIGTSFQPERQGQPEGSGLKGDEHRWGPAADLVLTMAPDVGTSTNINPAMDSKIYGPQQEDFEAELGLRDRRRPQLAPTEEAFTRHIRFEIAEANCMSAVGAFGKLRDSLGVPFLPIMTVYDFFIKRAFDQLYYNLYWGSSFICVGTPSGVTLAPEGAQHSWKSDIGMPNVIIWEPFYAVEMDWILSETVRRHYTGDNKKRTGVIIRAVTRSFKQAEMLPQLKLAKRFEGHADEAIMEATRLDAIEGAYYLIDRRGHAGYEPGENVINIFAMGAICPETVAASDRLLSDGIFANVIVVTCGDLLCGNLAHDNDYRHLREGLKIDGDLHLTRASNGHAGATNGSSAIANQADWVLAAGRRVPMLAIVDGEPGILDNLGSIVGVPCETLAVRKASKSGRPVDVYNYQDMGIDGIYRACGRMLSQTATENVRISRSLLAKQASGEVRTSPVSSSDLWPPRQ
jgi:pyruvate dehydrogenase E1 component